MPDPTWTLAGHGIDAVIPDSPSFPDVTPGQRNEWRLLFHVESSGGFGPSYTSRHASVLEIATAAETGVVDWGTSLDGDPYFHEQVPSAFTPTTFVALLDPQGSIGRSSRWVLVVGGDDDSPPVGGRRVAQVSLVDLADGADYATAGDVQSALEVTTA